MPSKRTKKGPTKGSGGKGRRALAGKKATLPAEKRHMFVRRYWYSDPIASIARRFQTSENNVSANLSRIRKKLKAELEERGYDL